MPSSAYRCLLRLSRRACTLPALAAAFLATEAAAQSSPTSEASAVALVDRAIARMGGESILRGLKSLRLEFLTLWQRAHFGSHPYADQPSFERNAVLFDFERRGWRNTRTFLQGAGFLVDIVADTLAQRTSAANPSAPPVMAPLNIAYIDERREQLAFAPERTLLVAKDAGGLRLLRDTVIDGVAHARVAGSAEGFAAVWFIRRTDGLPALVRYRADEINDYGLAPWGVQEVEIWWSAWAWSAPGLLSPRQRDTRRAGRPYKRISVFSVTPNAPAPPNSFAIADSIRARYLAEQRRPMWMVPFDGARIVADHYASFPPFAGSAGAVSVGGQWVLLETAQHPGAVELIHRWLATQTPAQPLGLGIVSRSAPSNGGARWFVEHGLPVVASAGSAPALPAVLGDKADAAKVRTARTNGWMQVGSDSLWLERLELPDNPGALAVYSPSLRWLYSALWGNPAYQPEFDAVISRLRAKGLAVEWVGTARSIRSPAPAPPPLSSK
jgi:hypothetical protein